MAKDNSITINADDLRKGIQSAYTGFQEIRGLNIYDTPGIIYPNFPLIKSSGSTIVDDIKAVTTDGSNHYMNDLADVFKKTSGNVWSDLNYPTATAIASCQYWKDYLFVFAVNGQIDIYGPISNTPTWTANWASGSGLGSSSASKKPTLVADNDKMYVGVDNRLWSLEELTTFDPTSSATYSITTTALDLQEDLNIVDIKQLADKLMIGTSGRGALIFPWDMTSVSFTLPITIQEKSINSMINVNNLLYVQAGDKGKFYVTNGVTAELFYEMPRTLITALKSSNTTTTQVNKNSLISLDNKLIFGFDSSTIPGGVYSISLQNKSLNLEYMPSHAEEDGTISAIFENSLNTICVAWYDNDSTYGVDITNSSNRLRGDKAYGISNFYRVGTKLRPRTFQNIELELAKDMISGQSIEIQYRESADDTWVSIATFNTLAKSFYAPFAPTVTNIQFKIIINSSSTGVVTNEFLELKIK